MGADSASKKRKLDDVVDDAERERKAEKKRQKKAAKLAVQENEQQEAQVRGLSRVVERWLTRIMKAVNGMDVDGTDAKAEKKKRKKEKRAKLAEAANEVSRFKFPRCAPDTWAGLLTHRFRLHLMRHLSLHQN